MRPSREDRLASCMASKIWYRDSMIISFPAIGITAVSSVYMYGMSLCRDMNRIPKNTIIATAMCTAAMPAWNASLRCPAPNWCDTRMVAAEPMPVVIMNDSELRFWAI